MSGSAYLDEFLYSGQEFGTIANFVAVMRETARETEVQWS